MYTYTYKQDSIGGVVIRQCIGGIPVREVYVQPGDDAARFFESYSGSEDLEDCFFG